MKKILVLLLCSFCLTCSAQDVSVENSVFGVQTGFLGIWVHNESKLSRTIALRSEVGFDTGFWYGFFDEETGILMAPVLTIEPRFYYNLAKRVAKSKNISNNAGNFLSIKSSYHPNWLVISNYSNVRIISNLTIVPTWGIRRNIGKHVNFECGFGLGLGFSLQKPYKNDYPETVGNLHLRIGYVF